MSDFIKITDLKHSNINTEKKIYQVQPHKSSIVILHVGNMQKIYDINISTFNTPNNYTCHIINKIYDIDLLNEQLLNSNSQIQLITVLICLNKNNYPSAFLSFNFHPKKLETNYLSTKDNIIHIDGKYSISLHLNNKKIIKLEDVDEFIDNDNMMIKLYGLVFDEDVINLINKNVK